MISLIFGEEKEILSLLQPVVLFQLNLIVLCFVKVPFQALFLAWRAMVWDW